MKINTYLFPIALTLFSISAAAQNIDSMQKTLDTTKNVCTKLDLYTYLAADAIQFNRPQTRQVTYADADKAVVYVLKAIHYNAKNNDTLALRNNFDCLSQAYFIEKKYTQAKWFTLQSNCISRDRRDVPRIIYSLMQMATIKTATKEYKLAQKDLHEAEVLSRFENNLAQQIAVERKIAALYDKLGCVKLALATVKQYSDLTIELKKQNQLNLVAMKKAKEAEIEKELKLQELKSMFALVKQQVDPQLDINNGIWMVADSIQPVKLLAFERAKLDAVKRQIFAIEKKRRMLTRLEKQSETQLVTEDGVWRVKVIPQKDITPSNNRQRYAAVPTPQEQRQAMVTSWEKRGETKLNTENGIWTVADSTRPVVKSKSF